MNGSYESQAVQSNGIIMRSVDAGGGSGGDDSDREAEIQQAKDDAQDTVDNAVAETERILKEMEDKVAQILADAQLEAEQKKLQVEQAVKEAIEQIN